MGKPKKVYTLGVGNGTTMILEPGVHAIVTEEEHECNWGAAHHTFIRFYNRFYSEPIQPGEILVVGGEYK